MEEWQRWRGGLDARVNDHETRIEEHCDEIDALKKSVSDILVKLAVPLFFTSLVGVVLGGIIVALLTSALKGN